MDAATLTTRCATRFRDPNNNIVTAVQWLEYVNETYADVIGASPHWPFLENSANETLTVNAGSRSVALPPGVSRVTAVRNATDDVVMTPVDGRTTHMHAFPEQTETGVPQFYRVYGQDLEVYPLPEANTALQVEYPAAPALLTTGEPVFAEQYHHILVEGALALAYTDDGAPEQSAAHSGRFDTILFRMKNDYLGAGRHDSLPTIVDTWWN